MWTTEKVVAFVPTADPIKARSFYEGILGLRAVSEDRFAWLQQLTPESSR
jgi:hypothetical protein